MGTFSAASDLLRERLKNGRTEQPARAGAEATHDMGIIGNLEGHEAAVKLLKETAKGAEGKYAKSAAASAKAKLDQQLSLDVIHGHVADLVRKDADDTMRGCFSIIVANAADYKDALSLVKEVADRTNALNAPLLRQYLHEYFRPSRQTMQDAGISQMTQAALGGGAAPQTGKDA